MSRMAIPGTPNELTPEWLTNALLETETIERSKVTSFDMEPDIAAGTGFMRQLARLIAPLTSTFMLL